MFIFKYPKPMKLAFEVMNECNKITNAKLF